MGSFHSIENSRLDCRIFQASHYEFDFELIDLSLRFWVKGMYRHEFGFFFSTQRICDTIRFPRVIVDLTVIVFYQLEPPSLSHIEVFLSKDILEALMVCENLTSHPIEVVSLNLQGKDHSRHF